MKGRAIFKTGAVGADIAVIRCFTPALVVVLGAVDFSARSGRPDYVLFPAMAVFMAMTAYGLYLRRDETAEACCTPLDNNKKELRL